MTKQVDELARLLGNMATGADACADKMMRSLRRRSQLSNERALERYIQEAVYALTENVVAPNALSRVVALTSLLPDLLGAPELNE